MPQRSRKYKKARYRIPQPPDGNNNNSPVKNGSSVYAECQMRIFISLQYLPFRMLEKAYRNRWILSTTLKVDSGSGKRYNVIRKGKTYNGGAL